MKAIGFHGKLVDWLWGQEAGVHIEARRTQGWFIEVWPPSDLLAYYKSNQSIINRNGPTARAPIAALTTCQTPEVCSITDQSTIQCWNLGTRVHGCRAWLTHGHANAVKVLLHVLVLREKEAAMASLNLHPEEVTQVLHWELLLQGSDSAMLARLTIGLKVSEKATPRC